MKEEGSSSNNQSRLQKSNKMKGNLEKSNNRFDKQAQIEEAIAQVTKSLESEKQKEYTTDEKFDKICEILKMSNEKNLSKWNGICFFFLFFFREKWINIKKKSFGI